MNLFLHFKKIVHVLLRFFRGSNKRASVSFFPEEVIQISATDCGPACLTSVAKSYGRNVSYDNVREACRTSTDGASVDDIASTAEAIGLLAEQQIIPISDLSHISPQSYPAIVVVTVPDGNLHFIVVWKVFLRWAIVMDPAEGTSIISLSKLYSRLYVYAMPIESSDWDAWARSDECLDIFRRRLHSLGIQQTKDYFSMLEGQQSWYVCAAFDASISLTESLMKCKAIESPGQADQCIRHYWSLIVESNGNGENADSIVPSAYWSVQSAHSPSENWNVPSIPKGDNEEMIYLRGIIWVSLSLQELGESGGDENIAAEGQGGDGSVQGTASQRSGANKSDEGKVSVRIKGKFSSIVYLLQDYRVLSLSGVLIVLLFCLVSASLLFLESILLSALVSMQSHFSSSQNKVEFLFLVGSFLVIHILFEFFFFKKAYLVGRTCDLILRKSLINDLAEKSDKFLSSRPISDVGERMRSIHNLKAFPFVAVYLAISVFEFIFTILGLSVLFPVIAPWLMILSIVYFIVPSFGFRLQSDREYATRTISSILGGGVLDALLGKTAAICSSANRSIGFRFSEYLGKWEANNVKLVDIQLVINVVLRLIEIAFVAIVIYQYLESGQKTPLALLFLYWLFKLPRVSETLVGLVSGLASLNATAMRIEEAISGGGGHNSVDPSTMPSAQNTTKHEGDVIDNGSSVQQAPSVHHGCSIFAKGLVIRISGKSLLDIERLEINSGEKIAIVGRSGSGKSTFIKALLRVYPIEGELEIDGNAYWDPQRDVAWVDPDVFLWPEDLLYNIAFGNTDNIAELDFLKIVKISGSEALIHRTDSLRQYVEEFGTNLSGGEGQRLKMMRALAKRGSRLVLMDEALRGLDSNSREKLISEMLKVWSDATILNVTHNVVDSHLFDRVLVFEDGLLVEDGVPRVLAEDENSVFHKMCLVEKSDKTILDGEYKTWRKVTIQ